MSFKFIVLCAFVCKVGYFDAPIREILMCQIRCLTYLPLWENVTDYLQGIYYDTNLHSSWYPPLHLWKILHKFQANSFWLNPLTFIVIHISTSCPLPTYLTFAKPKSRFRKPGLREVLSLKHRLSHPYLNMRQECRTFKSVAPRPCGWLLLVLTIRAQGAHLI